MQRGQSGKAKPQPPPQPVELLLGSFPSAPPPNSFYRGTVVSLHPYHAGGQYAAIVLGPLSSAAQGARKMEVRFKGTWAEDAIKRFVVGKPVGVQAEGGKRQQMKKPKGPQAEQQGLQWAENRLVFDQRVAGFVWNSDDEDDVEAFEYPTCASTYRPPAPAAPARVELPNSSPQQQLPISPKAPTAAAVPSIPFQPVASTSRLASPPPAPTDDIASPPPPARKSSVTASKQSTRSASPEPRKSRNDKPSSSTRAEKEVLATSQEKVEDSGSGKGKQKEDTKRKISQEGEGSRTQRKKKKLERKWELEVTKKNDPVFGNNATISYIPLSKHDRSKAAKRLNVIAVASVHNPPRRAERGDKDWTTSLRLIDPTRLDEYDIVNYYAAQESDLPKIEDGDVVVLQNLNWSNKGGGFQSFIGYKQNVRSLVFPRTKLLASPCLSDNDFLNTPLYANRVASCGPQEVAYARDMAQFMESEAIALAAAAGGGNEDMMKKTAEERSAALWHGGSTKRAMREIQDMEGDNFCDTVVQVIKIWTGGQNIARLDALDHVTVYVSDYTRHPEVFVSDVGADAPQFADGLVLQVSVYGVQAQPLVGVEQSKLLHLRNLRPKYNPHGLLEAAIHPDPKFPDKRDITVLKSRKDYTKEIEALDARRKAWQAGNDAGHSTDDAPPKPTVPSPPTEVKQKALPSITCPKVDDAVQTMQGAINLHSQGIYHFKGRVVDYHPAKFEDWINLYCNECGELIDVVYDLCPDHPQASTALMIWSVIRVADDSLPAGHKGIPVLVRDGAESALLPSLTLTPDMRRPGCTGTTLLRQRFAPILGNLVALKNSSSSSAEGETETPTFDMSLVATEDSKKVIKWYWAEGMAFGRA